METVTVSSDYQIVIPERVREMLSVEPGQKMKLFVYNGRIEFVPIYPAQNLRGFLAGMDTTIQREREDRV